MANWLDKDGVTYLWSKIKSLLSSTTYTKNEVDVKIAGVSTGVISITEIDETQIDTIISGGDLIDDGDEGAFEEITEEEIDVIIASE